MRRAEAILVTLAVAGCTTTLEMGERKYRDGDRLGALEIWRTATEDQKRDAETVGRIAEIEEEFAQLVVRYKKRAGYFETKRRLAESILNYRLALKLQPHDGETLAHVQLLARELDIRKTKLQATYRVSMAGKDLAAARDDLDRLRTLDPFDPELETAGRQLGDALFAEVTRSLAAGRRGFSTGNYAAAQLAFRAALALDPDNESARGYLSYIATIHRENAASGKDPAAFDASGPFATDADIRSEGFYQNGLVAERASDLYTAIRHFDRALVANPDHLAARQRLTSIRQRLSTRVEPLIEAGRNQFATEDLQPALDLWRRALLIDPDNPRAKAYVARAERQLENLEALRSEPDVATRRR